MPKPDPIRTIAVLLLALPQAAAAALDIRVSAASEEVFRGVVQNNSLTGSFRADYRFASRAYVGGRLLNNRSAGDAQVDVYAGIARSLVLLDLIPVGVDGGINVSLYSGDRAGPQSRDLDWAEAYAAVSSGPARLSVAFAPDHFGSGAAAWRAAGQLRLPLAEGFETTAVLGWNEGSGIRRHLAPRGGSRAYADYSLVISREFLSAWTVYSQLTGASIGLDASRRPRLLVGLRWRWGW